MRDEQVTTVEQVLNDVEVAFSRNELEGLAYSIEVRDGKIQCLRAYAGWRAVATLTVEGAP